MTKTTIAKGMSKRFTAELRNDLQTVIARLERVYGGFKYISTRCILNGLSVEGWWMPDDYYDGNMSADDALNLIANLVDQSDMFSKLSL